MAYTINQGYHEDRRLDWLQRGLLVGLPVLALILSVGAIIGHHNASTGSTTGHNPKLIPIISSLSGGTGTGNTGTGGSNSDSSSLSGSSSSTGANTGSLSSATGSGTAASSGSIAPVVGGRGGGPTGGTGGSGGSTGGTAATTASCVDKLTGQASVCIFPYQTCTVPLSGITGYKTVDGTCIVVN